MILYIINMHYRHGFSLFFHCAERFSHKFVLKTDTVENLFLVCSLFGPWITPGPHVALRPWVRDALRQAQV